MPSHQKMLQRDAIAEHARSAFGMRSWIADAYADIATAEEPSSHSATSTLRACNKLTRDDTGNVDPLVSALAYEVLRLNQATVALTPNMEATMRTVLDLLGLQYAEPEEKTKLLATLGSYLRNHEFADDAHFRHFANVIQGADETQGPAI